MSSRNITAALLVTAFILFSGGFLLRGSEVGTQLTVAASFAIGQMLLFLLDGRERRRQQGELWRREIELTPPPELLPRRR